MKTCPTCKRPLPPEPANRPLAPFCSERCRLADLGSWLDGAYRIGAPLSETDLDEGLPTEGGAGLTGDGKTPAN